MFVVVHKNDHDGTEIQKRFYHNNGIGGVSKTNLSEESETLESVGGKGGRDLQPNDARKNSFEDELQTANSRKLADSAGDGGIRNIHTRQRLEQLRQRLGGGITGKRIRRTDSSATDSRAVLPANFTSPAQARATLCATKTGSRCFINPCQQQHDRNLRDSGGNNNIVDEPPNYGHGFILRDNAIRGTTMTVPGRAAAGSGCALSDRYRFIYVHVLKSGGMTFKAFLKRALCNGRTDSICSAGSAALRIVDCDDALREHPEYLVWSFVRNPYGRLYSGYSMASSFRKNRAGSAELPPFSFTDFVLKPTERQRLSHASPVHYAPQRDFLFDGRRTLCPVFDFLGRLERLDEDLRKVLEVIRSPELTAYVEALNGTIHHEESTAYGRMAQRDLLSGNLQNAYRLPSVVAAAATEYAADFALFGYPSEVVPTS